jgi:hypothetical protein
VRSKLFGNTELAFKSRTHQLAARLYSCLAEEPLHYVLHTAFGNSHPGANLSIRQALHYSCKDRLFPLIERDAEALLSRMGMQVD